jgi:hypothetical protein
MFALTLSFCTRVNHSRNESNQSVVLFHEIIIVQSYVRIR